MQGKSGIPTNGLIARYDASDSGNSSAVFKDLSGNGKNIQLTGFQNDGTDGFINGSLVFTGTKAALSAVAVNSISDFTIILGGSWTTGECTTQQLLNTGGAVSNADGLNGVRIVINSTGDIIIGTGNGTSGSYKAKGITGIETINKLVIKYNYAQDLLTVKVNEVQQSVSCGYKINFTKLALMYFTNTKVKNGKINKVALYNRILNDSEVEDVLETQDNTTETEGTTQTNGTGDIILYVSESGSDSNTGKTFDKALATFNKAIQMGATVIIAGRGVYHQTIKADGLPKLEILPYESPSWDSSVTEVPKIEINNGTELTALVSSQGVLKQTFKKDARFQAVFVDKSKPPVAATTRPTYNVGCWEITSNLRNDQKLKPVLTLEECQSEAGTFTYIGSEIYINPFDGVSTNKKFIVQDNVGEGININNCGHVVLQDVAVKFSYNTGMNLTRIKDLLMQNCEQYYTVFADGIKLDWTNGRLYSCGSYQSRNDGYNMHYYGDTHFNNCYGMYNGDDGLSHHEGCTGSITGGEFSYNGKAGVIPAYGARVNIHNVLCRNNAVYGISYTSEAGYVKRTCTITNCFCANNGIGICVTTGYEVGVLNCIAKDNTKENERISGTGILNQLN